MASFDKTGHILLNAKPVKVTENFVIRLLNSSVTRELVMGYF